ncbi:hypothetical protein J6TS2_19210 [Heyndrickxia sporothermodurans]|nr:hypothetical protein J6TS2_19210 [Heyndrickxia sporothermodurans]
MDEDYHIRKYQIEHLLSEKISQIFYLQQKTEQTLAQMQLEGINSTTKHLEQFKHDIYIELRTLLIIREKILQLLS